jgi:DNA-binding NtrC family response regulator
MCDTVRIMASVLVIAVDPNIEALMGQLLVYAGHRPAYDAMLGAAGETIRRTRPDLVFLDTELPRSVVQYCRDAALEAGTGVILMSSSASETELAAQARLANCPYFALPGGPNKLRELIRRTLPDKRAVPLMGSGEPPSCPDFHADP